MMCIFTHVLRPNPCPVTASGMPVGTACDGTYPGAPDADLVRLKPGAQRKRDRSIRTKLMQVYKEEVLQDAGAPAGRSSWAWTPWSAAIMIGDAAAKSMDHDALDVYQREYRLRYRRSDDPNLRPDPGHLEQWSLVHISARSRW